jgi:flagellar biosynthesis protein FlhG
MIINEHSERKVLPIASGKGGVGKTIVAANLALNLAINGRKTVVIDLDLGGSNLHTALGMKNVNPGIGNFISSRSVKFNDILLDTPYQNLKFIPGDVLVTSVTNTQFSQKKKLLQNILDLDVDCVVIDLGSGGSSHVVDFFLIANSGFVVVTPQSTSLVNAYLLLKNLVFRFLQRAFSAHGSISSYIRKLLKEKKPNAFPPMSEILEKMTRIDRKAGAKAERYLSALQPKFVVNMAKSPDDLHIVVQLRDLVKNALSVDVECMGLIFHDDAVDRSLEAGTPLVTTEGDSIAAREIERISQKVLQSENFPVMPLDLESYADTYELAMLEAQTDFEEMQAVRRESEDEIDAAEMLAVISEQQRQIDELRGTIRMLTIKGR